MTPEEFDEELAEMARLHSSDHPKIIFALQRALLGGITVAAQYTDNEELTIQAQAAQWRLMLTQEKK